MSVLAQYKELFVNALAEALAQPAADIAKMVKPAADPAHGDFAFPTARYSKQLGKPPPAIATDLVGKIKVEGLEVAAAGPYVNARILAMPFTQRVLDAARSEGVKYGGSTAGSGKTVVIDYSSPNIAKPIAFHHIRSTVIGHALANLYRSQGWKVEGINYLGDWGKQFGLVAVGFEEYGDASKRDDMGHLVEVYVKANRRAEEEKPFDEKAREFFRRMEAGDEKATALWKEFRATSLKDFKKLYQRLGIAFEHFHGESDYQGKMDAVIDEITRTVGTKLSQGALIVDLPYKDGEPPVLLKKDDGSTLYATRDLAAAIDRQERFKFDRALYVVANQQSLHFKQFFGVLEKMGKPWAKSLVHISFGMVKGMSTRSGKITLLSDVLDEAKQRALEKVKKNIEEGKIKTEDPEGLAEQIGLGAIVFGDLKNRRTTDYEFNWDDVLSTEGHTGVYLQYAHARACNLLVNGGGKPASFDAAKLTLPEEQALVREIARFPQVLSDAVADDEPSTVSRYLLDVASALSRWYTAGNQDREKRVLVDDAAMKAARLGLADSARIVLRNGLNLLGIAAPEQM
jgi:arginyl-tRNA synthetase